MSDQLFKAVKAALPDCNMIPERAKEILNTVDFLYNLNEKDLEQLWILLHDVMKDISILNDVNEDIMACCHCILNLLNHVINSTEDMILLIGANEYLLRTISIFQIFYSKECYTYKFKLEIAKMCYSFWKLTPTSKTDEENSSFDMGKMMNNSFIFTIDYLFDTIKTTTKKFDMKALTSLLWKFSKIMSTMSSNQKFLDVFVLSLEKNMKHSLFLDTDTGRMVIAEIFTITQQLFLRLHQIIKKNLPKAKKLVAESYGEIYFIAWINSNATMKEVIEQQGMFDLISKTLILQRKGSAFRTYRNALITLQSIQSHRKHLMFSKVITNLYAPVLWRHLRSEFSVIRCNATEVLARAYPLEKRGEGREVSSRFLIKQQDEFLGLLVDPCWQVRIAAIKGICGCMRYFWDSFEEDRINKCFNIFACLMDDNVFEVRRVIYYGFCQLLDEFKSREYFKAPFLMDKMKNTLNDQNEKVRRAFIHFLLKVKENDIGLEQEDKINFAHIVNLHNTANALSREDKQNGLLLVDLIFDNFIGERAPDKHATIMRFHMFYKINPTAFRKLILYSEKNLEFNDACKLILSLLKTVYSALKKKEERLKDIDKENNIPNKRRKIDDDTENASDTSNSSASNNEDNEKNEHTYVCCILDCVHCLMVLHRKKFIEESNHQQMNEIQESCTSCLIKLLKFYKEGDAYFSAMNLASLVSVTKLSSHVAVPSAALSTLKQLPYDVEHAEEEIDMRKVSCLVYTLCMWKRGYEILQFVNVWLDDAFKTLSLNETQYPESIIKEGKRVRFKTDIEQCKPMTGILLINSMLENLQTQKTLLDSDVNRKNIYDLILYLQRVKPAIENRISSDNVLNNLLSDELLIELFHLKMRLHIIYHVNEENRNVDEIIKYQTSTLDWVLDNLLIHDFHHKKETTVVFAAKIIGVVNNIVKHIILTPFVNNTFLDYFLTFCTTTVVHNNLAPRILTSMAETLVTVSKHFYFLKQIDNLINDTKVFTNCVCKIVSTFGKSKYNEESFTLVVGEPVKLRHELTMLISEIYKINSDDFKQVFTILIETIMEIIANQIQEIDELDLYEQLTEMPFAAYQLATMILSNAQLRKHFSSNAVVIFSSDTYKNDCVMLLSAISYVYTLSFQLNQSKNIDLEPVVKLLYKTLMEHNETTTPLGENCTIKSTKGDQEVSILETSDFSNGIMDFKQKGRNVLIATAKQLRITLSD